MSNIIDARRLQDAVTELGGEFPAPLTGLLDLVGTIKTLPPAPDPTAVLIEDALAGRTVELSKLIASAAKAENEAGYAQRLRTTVERDSMRRFVAEIRSGGADAILDSVRPKFEATAKRIAALRDIVDPSWSTDTLVAQCDPDQLGAYREYPSLVAVIDRFASLVAQLGRNGIFAVLEQPGHGAHNELVGLRDEALFLTDSDPFQASGVINARRADWRTSPWLRVSLRLNTIDAVRERLRALAESAFDAIEMSRGQRGSLTADGYKPDPKRSNPFALTEAA
jgi:hypothetical protein